MATRGGALPPNPDVVALVNAVSADSIRASLERMLTADLTGFFTRHTNSDTLSATTGIGAARRWAHGRLSSFALTAAAPMPVGYFDFDTTVCGIPKRHRNVLATLTGSTQPDRLLLVSAHLDTRTVDPCDATAFAPGANDDGSGVALVLEMARVLRTLVPEASLRFLLVTGEEQGLIGSTQYAKHAVSQGLDIDGMITNDIVGNVMGCVDPACPPKEPVIVDSTSVRHFSKDPHTGASRQLARSLALSAGRYVPDLFVTLVPAVDRPGRAGDHIPFGDRGYPAARFTEANEDGDGTGTNGHQHNGADLLPFVDVNYVTRVTRLNVAGFANLVLAPETPLGVFASRVAVDSVRVSWSAVTSAPDLAGYRVAFRPDHADSVFYADLRDVGLPPGSVPEVVLPVAPDLPASVVSVSAYDADFNESRFSEEVFVSATVTTPEAGAPERPPLRLLTPNPTTGVVHLAVPEGTGPVRVDVLDVAGRRIRTLSVRDGAVTWDGRTATGLRAAPGVYVLRARTPGQAPWTLKITLVE